MSGFQQAYPFLVDMFAFCSILQYLDLRMGKIMKTFLYAAFVLLLSLTPLSAKEIAERFNIGGYINVSKTTPYKLTPNVSPLVLADLNSLKKNTPINSRIIDLANTYLTDYPATTALLLIENGQILYEAYQGAATRNSEFFSMSIAKSLTSMTLGKALCNGLVNNLKQKASHFIPELAETYHGQSTIHQLLKMSSGTHVRGRSGQPKFLNGIGFNPRTEKPYTGISWPLRRGQATVDEILWGRWWAQVDGKNASLPGEKFSYKAIDTLTISKTIERQSGMSSAAYFDQEIWKFIGAEHVAHWEADKNGSTIASSGFQASLRDWGRLGLWILDAYKRDDCYGAYLKEATRSQIQFSSGSSNGFSGYGYQWWTDPRYSVGFWGLGYAGQLFAINPERNKILLKFSYRADKGSARNILKLFKTWSADT